MMQIKYVIIDFLGGYKMQKKLYKKDFEVIDLSNIGIQNLCFDLITCIEFMIETIKNGDLILGGDIIQEEDGKYVLSYDNWYSASKDPEITFIDAMRYLKEYTKNNQLLNWKIAITTSVY